MSYYHHLIKSAVVPAYGALTTAWITATSETDTTIISALNTLETDLTTYGLTAKIKALYPMVGGTAAKHKFNFMDARDLDAAYRLTFNGGWTHSSNGALPNGTNAYADTFLNEDATLTLNNEHISYYSRTNSTGSYGEMGTLDIATIGNPGIGLHLKWIDGNFYPRVNDNNSGIANPGTSEGLFVSNRTNSTQIRAFQNGVLKLITSNSIAKTNFTIYIGALHRQDGAIVFYTNRQCAFSTIGSGLSDTEAANLYTAVQAFQTTLSRQV